MNEPLEEERINIFNPRDKTFQELLAQEANEDKAELVMATIKAFKEGDAGAQKMVMQAIADSMYSEESKFPISDERFKEIICIAADRVRGE